MSLKLDGKKLSLEIEERLNDYISSNRKFAKRDPGLAVIRIGEDPARGMCESWNKELHLPSKKKCRAERS